MANLGTLSTQRLQSGGSSGGLKPSLLPAGGSLDRLSLAAGRVDPSAAQVQFTPAQIPSTVKDQVTPALNDFASTVVKSVFDYQERESEYLANKAHLQYSEMLRNKYYGTQTSDGEYIPGYSNTTGDLAISEYANFQKFSDDTFNEIIGNLEPRVKAKALIKLQSTKGTYLGKASVHRSTQLQEVQERQRYAAQQNIMYELAASPESYNVPDPITGQTLKSKFYSTFQTMEDADSAWRNALVDVAKLRYLNTYRNLVDSGARESTALASARSASKEFIDNIAAPELANSPAHMGALLSDLKGYEEEARSAFISEETLAIRLSERAEQQRWDANEAKIESEITGGNIPKSQTISDMAESGLLDPAYVRNLRKEFYDPVLTAPDPVKMLGYKEQIRENAARGFTPQYDSEGNLIPESLPGFYNKKPEVFSESRQILRDYENSLNDPSYRDRESRGAALIKAWTKGQPWHKLQEEKLSTIEWQATEELTSRLRAGEEFKEIMPDLFDKYNSSMNNLRLRGDLPEGQHPMNGSDLREAIRYYDNNKSNYTEDEWDMIQAQLNGYARDIEEVLRKKAQSSELFK